MNRRSFLSGSVAAAVTPPNKAVASLVKTDPWAVVKDARSYYAYWTMTDGQFKAWPNPIQT